MSSSPPWTSPTRHRSRRSSPRGTDRWTSWSTMPASWRARRPAHYRAGSFSSPPITLATSRSPPACTMHSQPPEGPASSRSAPEPTSARRWTSTTSTSARAPTNHGTHTRSRRPPMCSSRWRRPGAGKATASPPMLCSPAPSDPTCSDTSPMTTWSAPAYTSKTTMGASTGRRPSREPQRWCCSRPHRCSRGSAAATSKTATRQDQASQALVAASPPTRSTQTRRRGFGRCPFRCWRLDNSRWRADAGSQRDLDGSIGCQASDKPLPVDLAGGKHGQVVLGDKANHSRNLERRQVAASVGNDGLDRHPRPVGGHDSGPNHLSADRVRQGDHEAVQDFRHRIQHGLDLSGRNVGSRGLDESACAAGEVQVAGVVEPSPIPGGVPAVRAEHFMAFLLVDTVHQDQTANLNLTLLAGGRGGARGGVDDPVLHHAR